MNQNSELAFIKHVMLTIIPEFRCALIPPRPGSVIPRRSASSAAYLVDERVALYFTLKPPFDRLEAKITTGEHHVPRDVVLADWNLNDPDFAIGLRNFYNKHRNFYGNMMQEICKAVRACGKFDLSDIQESPTSCTFSPTSKTIGFEFGLEYDHHKHKLVLIGNIIRFVRGYNQRVNFFHRLYCNTAKTASEAVKALVDKLEKPPKKRNQAHRPRR